MKQLAVIGFVVAVVGTAQPADAQVAARQQAWLGVGIQNTGSGVLVTEVIEGTPADDAGLKNGDVITKVDNASVLSTSALITQVSRRRVGDTITLRVTRGGTTLLLKAMLDRRLSKEELLNRRLLGKLAPDFELAVMTAKGVAGKQRLSNLRGKVVVIEFWATHCFYCRKVHPVLSKLQAKYKNDLVVLGLADDRAHTLRSHLAKARNIRYATLHDKLGAVKRTYFVQSTPTLVVVDRKGVVRFAGIGAGANAGNAIGFAEGCVKKNRP